MKQGKVQLERALSKLGLASRTQAKALILSGKVRVNGFIRKDPLFLLNLERAKIEVDGQVVGQARPRTLLLFKPKGVVTTRSDEKGRPTVFSLIVSELDLHLIAVGRLDLATTGIILLTNDTKLAAWLTDPVNLIPRVYLVTVRGEVSEEKLRLLQHGIRDQDELLRVSDVSLRKSSGKESHLTVTLTEGKNREIRRIFLALAHEVTRLKRVSYGALELGDLQPGEYREVEFEELARVFPNAPIKRP